MNLGHGCKLKQPQPPSNIDPCWQSVQNGTSITYIKGRPEVFHPSIRPIIHPSKFLIPEEEEEE
jgi:hypothetical protein